MSALQIVGTLLAIPVGIGSGYSMYRANFSAEATCQSLRGNIVAMLDKSVDAGTRHILVRRDVEAFQKSCGTVDPDATAAFQALLAADKAAAPATTATVRRAEPRLQPVARKAVPDPSDKQPVVSAPAAPAVVAETAPVQRDAAASDAIWLAAVRGALVSHEREPAPAATATAAAPPSPAVPPRDLHTLDELLTPAAPLAAPTLPPATSVATIGAPPLDADHPVPPASIPELASEPKDGANKHSRLGDLVAQIPFVGRSLVDGGSR